MAAWADENNPRCYVDLKIVIPVDYSTVNMPQLIHSLVEEHIRSFQILVIMKHDSMNILVHMY